MGDVELKAVLMAAGPTYEKFGFPPDSKPKCLFHFEGEALMEKQVRVLREAGINDITVVAGYKIEMVQEFNKEKNLGLKVLYNPSAASDKFGSLGWVKGLETAKIGVRSIDDDVLLIFGDVLLTVEGIRIVVEDEYQCISVYSGSGYQLYKIPKSLIPRLIKYDGCPGGMIALHNFCMENGGIRMAISSRPFKDEWMKTCKTKFVEAFPFRDLDYYYMMEEGIAKGMTPQIFRKWLDEQQAKGKLI